MGNEQPERKAEAIELAQLFCTMAKRRADALFHELNDVIPWRAERRQMYDRVLDVPRSLETRGYQVVESNGSELVSRAVLSKPDIIILNSLLSSDEAVRALRFEKGMENVLFLIYQ